MNSLLRVLFVALAPVSFSAASAATYYVATNGDDARTAAVAQNASTPWKTIQKAAGLMVAGDTCLIKGGTYREVGPVGAGYLAVTPASSGTATAPITFQAYDATPVIIDGTEDVTGWTTSGGNIWNAPMAWSLGDGNQVFMSGVLKPEARWPNLLPDAATYPWPNSRLAHPTNSEVGDWSYVDSASYTGATNGAIVDAQLPDRDWAGATVHIMSGYGWVMSFATVQSFSNATKTLVTGHDRGDQPAYAFTAGNEYYLTGKSHLLDSPGEWFYDAPNTRLQVYATAAPSGVTAKKRPFGFNLANRSYIVLKNLRFFACSVMSNNSTASITYDGLNMKYVGHSRITNDAVPFGLQLRNNDVLRNSELAYDSRSLVRIFGGNVRIINNYLHDSGYVPNWESIIKGETSYYGNLISRNTLQHAGRAAMGFPGRASIVEYNDMSDAMKLTTDGAVLYTNGEANNSIIRYNLFHDSIGPVGHGGAAVQGFYLDQFNDNWVVHHNIIWGVPGYAIQINARHNFGKIFNNSCWNATKGALLTSFPMGGETGTHVFNNLFNAAPTGSEWSKADLRFNLYGDPLYSNPSGGNFQLQAGSPAIDAGTHIPGITDGFGGDAPDLGALESGAADWTTGVGYKTTPPSPDPVYSLPAMSFANQVKDGSFETSALAPNWTAVANSNVSIVYGSSWTDPRLRSDFRSVQFGVGTSEISQTVTGLIPGRRYKVYASVQHSDPSTTVKLGARSYGRPAVEVTASPVALPPPVVPPAKPDTADVRWWTTYDQTFITGPTSNSAQIYLKVVIPSGVSTIVYADDFGLELADDPGTDPLIAMPSYELPFNQTTGTAAYDSTTHARNGTVVGGATWTTGLMGNALSFNGTNSYVTVPGAVPATSLGSFSVSTWVNFADLGTATNYSTLLSNNNGGWNVKGWQIKTSKVSPATNFSVGFYLWSANQTPAPAPPNSMLTIWFPTASAIAPNSWAHLAFVVDRDRGTLTAYLNGVATGSIAIPAGFGNMDTALGNMVGSTSFKGLLDDVRVYDYALNGTQVAGIYNADQSEVLRFDLNESPGATKAWNAAGNGNNGILTAMNTTTAWQNEALTFDGVDDRVTAGTTVPAVPSGSFTVATWVKFNNLGTATNYSTLVSNNNGGWNVKGWQIKTAKVDPATNYTVGFYFWSANQTPTPPPNSQVVTWLSPAVAPDAWTHVAFVVDRAAGTLTGYLNGVASSPATIPSAFTDADTALGTMIGSWTFSGQLDDVRIYSRALTWPQIMDLAIPIGESPF